MIIPTLKVKTRDSGNIQLNTDITIINMNEEEREINMVHIIMTQYALNIGLKKFKE